MSEAEAKQIQSFVEMARQHLTPLVKKANDHDRNVLMEVGTFLAAIDEVTGKEPT